MSISILHETGCEETNECGVIFYESLQLLGSLQVMSSWLRDDLVPGLNEGELPTLAKHGDIVANHQTPIEHDPRICHIFVLHSVVRVSHWFLYR